MASVMAADNLIKVIADTRTPKGTQDVYGGPYPGGGVYTTQAFIQQNPKAAQAVATAFVRGLHWIAIHSADEIAKLMPPEYALGNMPVYVKAIAASKAMYSPDGRFVPGAAETAYNVLKEFNPPVAAAPSICPRRIPIGSSSRQHQPPLRDSPANRSGGRGAAHWLPLHLSGVSTPACSTRRQSLFAPVRLRPEAQFTIPAVSIRKQQSELKLDSEPPATRRWRP
jgi:hypothetical protein